MTGTGYNAYIQVAKTTIDSKEMILLKLLEGSVRFMQAARQGLRARNPKVKGENVSRVIAIVRALDAALDREIGGSLADNLSALYWYILNRLTVANFKDDDEIMGEVEGLLSTIREGFVSAYEKETAAASSSSSYQSMPSVPNTYQAETHRNMNLSYAA